MKKMNGNRGNCPWPASGTMHICRCYFTGGTIMGKEMRMGGVREKQLSQHCSPAVLVVV